MKIDLIESPFHVKLLGKSGQVEGKCFGDRGKELMDAMWSEVQARSIENHGVNH